MPIHKKVHDCWGQGSEKGDHTLDGLGYRALDVLYIYVCLSVSDSHLRQKEKKRKIATKSIGPFSLERCGSLIARTISFHLTYQDGPWNQRKNTNLISPLSRRLLPLTLLVLSTIAVIPNVID